MTTSNFPTTYAEARAIFKNTRRRKLANNTYLEERFDPNWIAPLYAVRLHSTDVVTFRPNDTIELNTGGWRTVTTKERINRVLKVHGFTLYQKNHEWFIGSWQNDDLEPVEFYNGILVDIDREAWQLPAGEAPAA
jgi:hypothetical protein